MKRPSPYFTLWWLLVLSLIIFVGVSFSKDITLWGHTFTKARFPETLMARKEDPDEEEFSDAPEMADTLTAAEIPLVIEPDTTIHSLLIFGDSMTHNLAMSISKYGTKNRYKVTGVTWESSSIPAWRNSGKIREYMEMSMPDFIIICLGSNEMELKHFDRRIPDIEAIVSEMDSIPYIWVGPPLWKEDKGLYKTLEKGVAKGRLFKLENPEIERGPDHVHPTRKGADQWADTLMRWISTSYHPILTDRPDSGTTTRGHKFIYLHPDD